MVRSRLRLAARICVLAAGLLMGGGAVAFADPDSGDSAPAGNDGTNAPVQGSSPVGNITDTARKTVQGVTSPVGSARQPGQQPSAGGSTVGSGRQPGQQPSTGGQRPKNEAGGTDTTDEKKGAGLVAAVPDPVAAVPNVVAPATNVVAPVTDAVAPVTNVVAPVTDAVAPVINVVTPVTDVIATVQDTLTSVPNAVVPLNQLPSDLASFGIDGLFGITGGQPVADGFGGIDGPGLSAAAGASVAAQFPLLVPLAGIPGVPLAGNATGVATLDVIALGRASPLSGMAPLALDGANPMDVPSGSFFRYVGELLIRASLWVLAAAALPGVGGLVILTAAGVRVGYRQAKAGFALRPAGIARFAAAGPLGVFRSGSMVVVRPRPLRVVRPGVLSARRLPD